MLSLLTGGGANKNYWHWLFDVLPRFKILENQYNLSDIDLLRYNNSIPLYDSKGIDTLWETVFFPQDEMKEINFALKTIYAIMQSGGDVSVMKHLFVDRIDLCMYGNTKPFRVRIVNKINDNFDYFYVKHADASREYGMQLDD